MPRPEYYNPYGQSSRRPRLPLLQDPINNADPEAIAMLETIMNKTMGRGEGMGPMPARKSASGTRDTERLLPHGLMEPQTGWTRPQSPTPWLNPKALDAAQRYSREELQDAAFSDIYAAQNLGITRLIAESALQLLKTGMIDSPQPPPGYWQQDSEVYPPTYLRMGPHPTYP
jgi:hypothetical protein